MSNKIKAFVDRWSGKGYEKGQSQIFWTELLTDVLDVKTPSEMISFEDQVKLDHTAFIDAYIHKTHVMIEQKSIEKDLNAPIKQADGTMLTPFQQAKRYASELPYSQRPRWIITCNFRSFYVYDMEQPQAEPFVIQLENLEKEAHMLHFIVKDEDIMLKHEMEVSIKAGEMVGRVYDAFLRQFGGTETSEDLHALNVLCVRLVFCLYAEDAGIFEKDQFYHYLKSFSVEHLRMALRDLFQVLDTPTEQRDRFLEANLAAFPYVNGSLFRQQTGEVIPPFSQDVVDCLLNQASLSFDWSDISPTIFGAVFESTLNPETRRKGGMHYTSIENIHKVIDPLFLDDLKEEFAKIRGVAVEKTRMAELAKFQEKLASLKFLDPACGSGNFLTETYLSLRRLENQVIMEMTKGQTLLGFNDEFSPVKVSIYQFYGIEINDFAVDVATTALWIAESQMLQETQKIIDRDLDILPLKAYHNIKKGNALRESWSLWPVPQDIPTIIAKKANLYIQTESDLPRADEAMASYNEVNVISQNVRINPVQEQYVEVKFDYIMGNPPFVGARMMEQQQKDDMLFIFGEKWKNIGNLDYVAGWYKKAADLLYETTTRAALVSTNSITQGEQVANLWQPLTEQYNVHIDFAWKTFRWDSESTQKAHVHCVIVGFSSQDTTKEKRLFNESGIASITANINPYLLEAPTIFVESRNKPLCNVPCIGIGNKPIDGGNYLFTEDEMKSFVKKEPASAKYFRKWIGADEFINRWFRYCLWLGDCTPVELRSMPECMKRVQAVRELRLASKSEGTRKLADKPNRFHVENMPQNNYLLIPRVSSERRRYIPMGFITPPTICSDSVHITQKASLYHFGILTSNVHMAWMRAVCGRLKSDYRYSKDIVYNNFPWPTPNEEQKAKIEQTAQAILDARNLYPDSSLADLYDEVTMPPELRKAHQANDRAVMAAYRFPTKDFTESDCVAELLRMYKKLTEK